MDWSEGSLHAYIESKDENIILWVTFPLLYSLQRERSIRNRFSSRSNAKTVPLGEIQKSSLLGTKDITQKCGFVPRSSSGIDHITSLWEMFGSIIEISEKKEWWETRCFSLKDYRLRKHERMRMKVDGVTDL